MSMHPGGMGPMGRGRAFQRGGRGGPMGLGRPAEKARDFKGTVKRLTGYLKPFSLVLIAMLVLMAVSAVLSTIAPKIIGMLITKIFEGVQVAGQKPAAIDLNYLIKGLLFLSVLYIVNAFLIYIPQRSLSVIAQKVVYTVRKDVDQKLSTLPLKYFDTRTHGEIMSRMTNDVDNISNTLQQGLPQLISSGIGIAGAAVMMLVISPVLTLLTILTLPLSLLATMFIAKQSQKYFTAQQAELGKLNGHVEEMYSGHRVVKAFGYEKKSIKMFGEINQRLYRSGRRAQFLSGIIFPVMNFISNLGYVAVCVAGGIMVAAKKMQIGDITAFIQYIRMFTQPVAQAAGVVNQLQSAVASAERIFEVLDEEQETSDAGAADVLKKPGGDVKLENVKFGYRDDAMLFDGMNISVKAGQTIAIVGPTGAGKTTLVNLLMRFYDVKSGKITVDNTDIRDIKRGGLRRMFGMVLQDTWLFTGTIKENIAYGRETASDDEIMAAAKAAHADHFIRTLPGGYNTVLKEDASNISQGEKQLLTIARAVLADPAILILDEATSSVDTRTEVLIQAAMKTLMKGRTSFVIAHRLSTIRDAEMILVMDKGRIVETGKHNDLLAAKGFYAEMYKAQFTGAVE